MDNIEGIAAKGCLFSVALVTMIPACLCRTICLIWSIEHAHVQVVDRKACRAFSIQASVQCLNVMTADVDAILQKPYTVDFLEKKRAKNDGLIPQYYVEGSHEANISNQFFMEMQAEIA